jgi:hypothetical protein
MSNSENTAISISLSLSGTPSPRVNHQVTTLLGIALYSEAAGTYPDAAVTLSCLEKESHDVI